MDPGAVREGGEGDDPEVQSDLGMHPDLRLRSVRLGLEGNGPPSRLPGPGDVPESACDLPGDPDLDPSHLGEEDPWDGRSDLSDLSSRGRP